MNLKAFLAVLEYLYINEVSKNCEDRKLIVEKMESNMVKAREHSRMQ